VVVRESLVNVNQAWGKRGVEKEKSCFSKGGQVKGGRIRSKRFLGETTCRAVKKEGVPVTVEAQGIPITIWLKKTEWPPATWGRKPLLWRVVKKHLSVARKEGKGGKIFVGGGALQNTD